MFCCGPYPLCCGITLLVRFYSNRSDILNFILIQENFSEEIKSILKNDDSLVIILNNNEKHIIMNHQIFIIELINNKLQTPVIIQKNNELKLT